MAKKDSKSKGKKKGSGKGKTKSSLSLSERRLKADEMFGRGYTDTDVARELGVTRNTVAAYRKRWNENVKRAAASDPSSFRDVLTNTKKALDEIDQVRATAWDALNRKPGTITVVCEGCGVTTEYDYRFPPADTAKIGYLNLLTKTADQRAKLLGLMGVEQKIFVEIQNVNFVQNRMMAWLGENLDAAMRGKLADFIESELSEYVGRDEAEEPTAVIDSGVIDAIVRESVPALAPSSA